MLNEYRNHLFSAGRAEGTVRQRTIHIEALQHHHHDLMTVTTGDLEAILAAGRFTLKAETRKSMRSSYRVFYRWAHHKGYIPTDPAADLLPVHVPITVPRVAPDDVVQLALIGQSLQVQSMVLLARFACLRLSEVTNLHTRNREHDTLRIIGKGEKERLVGINDQLMEILLEREAEVGRGAFYFPGRWGGAMHPQSVNKIITRTTGCNPHSLRHAGATAAYRATGDLRAVQDMLGHSSMATTQRYLHLDAGARRRVAAGTAFVAEIHSPHFPQHHHVAA